jgi:hypothetical protein
MPSATGERLTTSFAVVVASRETPSAGLRIGLWGGWMLRSFPLAVNEQHVGGLQQVRLLDGA